MQEQQKPIQIENTTEVSHLDAREDVAEFIEYYFGKMSIYGRKSIRAEEMAEGRVAQWLTELFNVLPFPLTVVYEKRYVDSVYRDEYYRYYSRKHFRISRNCERLVFIKNNYSAQEILSGEKQIHDQIEEDIIGTCVIKPTCTIGRTLLNPYKLLIPKCYLRTTRFEICVMGRLYSLEAFPFSGQDSEVMTCAEVNVWGIMEYFGGRYKYYATMLPSEMLNILKDSSEVRVLPSDGLTVEQESLLFMRNGFSPKIYAKYDTIEQDGRIVEVEMYDSPAFEEILHFYIESGMPVLVNLREKNNPAGEQHSVTCIGHGYVEISKEILEHLKDAEKIDKIDTYAYNNIKIIKSWNLYKDYVIMEDHSIPYQVKSWDNLKFGKDGIEWEMDSFIVPLYKHIFLTAEDAYEVIRELISGTSEMIHSVVTDDTTEDAKIVIRLFLTTSRAYRQFRICAAEQEEEKMFYSQTLFPKFLWVCEYADFESYCEHIGKGEFVLDATSSKLDMTDSVIMIRHGSSVAYRMPEEATENVFDRRAVALDNTFRIFENNNLKCNVRENAKEA